MPRSFTLPLALVLASAVLAGFPPHAHADELVVNGGFEQGTSGWAKAAEATVFQNGDDPYSGNSSGLINTGSALDAEIYQIVAISPNEAYRAGAWVRVPDHQFDRVFVRIRWLESLGPGLGPTHDSAYVTNSAELYQRIETGFLLSPPYAVAARVSVHVLADTANFTFSVDDVSLEGAPPPPPTTQPTITPTQKPPTPQPTIVATTKPPTPKPSTPKPATPKPTPTPTKKPTPKPTPTPTPTPSPIPPSTPVDPISFSTLTNGGFEQTGGDGPYGWRKVGGTISQATSPVRSGSRSLELRSLTTSTKWAFQAVGVSGSSYYAASAHAWHADPDTDAVFLRISWYASGDGSGEAISTVDSLQLLEATQASWRTLTTGPVQAPADARSARIRLMLRPVGSAEALAYFDDVEFVPVSPPPVITQTATPVPGPGAPLPPGKTPTPKPAPTFAPPEEEDNEPKYFAAITNAGFEDVREDGTPYGWHKNGGEFSADDALTAEGALSLLMRSESSSTKWVHQAVSIAGGRWYEFAGFAAAPSGGAELFLRVSWYAASEGSGPALDSADSKSSILGPVGEFHHLTTGPIEAPGDARSARLRVMLRPATGSSVVGYFDALTFGATAAPASEISTSGGAGSRASGGGRSGGASDGSGGGEADAGGGSGAPVLGAAATPFGVANESGDDESAASARADNSSGGPGFWLWLAIGIPVAGLAAIGSLEARRWALRQSSTSSTQADD